MKYIMNIYEHKSVEDSCPSVAAWQAAVAKLDPELVVRPAAAPGRAPVVAARSNLLDALEKFWELMNFWSHMRMVM